MKRLMSVLTVVILFALTGCGGSKAVISENWNWRPATIAVIFTNPAVANVEDLEDDLPEYVNSFPVWMAAELKRDIESKAELLNNNSQMRVVVKHTSVGITGNGNFNMTETGITFNDRDVFSIDDDRLALPDADVYLFIDAININSVLTGGGMGLIGLLLHEGLMTMKATYSFYDGKTHKRLGLGSLEVVEDYVFGVSRSNWENLMEIAVKKLFDDTPVLECDDCTVRANWSGSGAVSQKAEKKSVWD